MEVNSLCDKGKLSVAYKVLHEKMTSASVCLLSIFFSTPGNWGSKGPRHWLGGLGLWHHPGRLSLQLCKPSPVVGWASDLCRDPKGLWFKQVLKARASQIFCSFWVMNCLLLETSVWTDIQAKHNRSIWNDGGLWEGGEGVPEPQ